jgi:hypothetical protein
MNPPYNFFTSHIALGTTCYVFEPGTLSPVPVDVAGELCLGGQQLAQGYLNLPEQSKDVFIPNPFGPGRLYRTGDMVILRANGSIEMVGRKDFQIKVNGHRVEPNESNSIIQLQPGVVNSCVLAASVLGSMALVGLIVSDGSKSWHELVSAIRRTLRDRMHSYAIPRYWVKMEQLPLNAAGKADIASLVKLVESMEEDELVPSSVMNNGSTRELRSDIKRLLAKVLSLKPENVNPAATFQDLGGSSLNAIVLSSKLRTLGLHVPVASILQDLALYDIFAEPKTTLASLIGPAKPFSLLPIDSLSNVEDVEDAYPVTPLQEGILADSVMGHVNYVYQRVYKIQGPSADQLRAALGQVVRRSSILRTTFKSWKRSFIQIVRKQVEPAWHTIKKQRLATALAHLGKQHMDVIGGSLIRATMIGEEYLVLEMHHSLFDFWSSQFVFADMAALLCNQEPSPRTPFSAYVAYQQTLVNDLTAKHFWQEYLKGASETLLVVEEHNTHQNEDVALEANIGNALSKCCDTGITIATVIHQAWALTLAQHTSQTDVMFMTAFSGRDAEVDGILTLDGPTLCIVPFRVSGLDSDAPVASHAKELQKNIWDLARYAHVGLRSAFAAASMKPTAINTMVNVLAKLEGVNADGPIAPVVEHKDNFTQ